MRSCFFPVLSAVLLDFFFSDNKYATASGSNQKKLKGYYPSYNSDAQSPAQIDWSAYTDVLYFMVIPQANNTLTFDPKLTPAQGQKLTHEFVYQAKQHHVNPILSCGGWTGSQQFSNLTLTETGRKKFAKLLVDFAKTHGFVGLEIDWEYPNGAGIGCNSRNSADIMNFGLLAKEIRALWPEVQLTAAVSISGLAGADGKPATSAEVSLLVQYLSFINLMAYDVYGAWADTTGPIAPLYNTCAGHGYAQSVETGVQTALQQGFKGSQILLGIPGYAKRLELLSPVLVPKRVDGHISYYYQNHTKTTPPGGRFDDKPGKDICGNVNGWGGSFLVTELISNGWLSADEKTGLNGYKRHFDECSGQPFLTNGKYFISYDDQGSTLAKAQFAKKHNLAGVYFFDTMGPTKATLQAARQAIMS